MYEAYSPSLARLEGRTINDHHSAEGAGANDALYALREGLAAAVGAVCPAWLAHQRDDIVQNAMRAVLRQQEKSEAERRFTPSYLKRAAFTATIDEIRRRRSRGEVPLEAEHDGDRRLVDRAATPERGAMAREISTGIRGCLERLASPRRMAVTFHLLGYKVPQIAQKTGWTRKQAENLVYRGMTNLRECLKSRGLEP